MRSASEKAAPVTALRNDGKQMELRASAKKDFETNSRVSSLLQVALAHFLTAESGLNDFVGAATDRKAKQQQPGNNSTVGRK
jgi:hypothetical protein